MKTGCETTTIEATLRGFMVENFFFGRDDGFANSDSFIGMGVLDSTGVLELVMFVEATWGIQVSDLELTPENMDSIDSVAALIRSKRQLTP